MTLLQKEKKIISFSSVTYGLQSEVTVLFGELAERPTAVAAFLARSFLLDK